MRTLSTVLSTAALLLMLAACDSPAEIDAGPAEDAGPRTDTGPDFDAGPQLDAGPRDAGPPPGDAGPYDGGPAINPLDGMGAVEEVMGGFTFLEGPHWVAADGVLLFTDIPEDIIFELTPPATLATFREPSANANGLATLPDGRLLAAEHGGRRVSVTEADGSVVDFAAAYQGMAFNSPNDLAVRSDGTVYFSDPPYGLGGRAREIDFNGVYRVTPGGEVTAEWEGAESTRPNGVALSPDERTFYFVDTVDGMVRAFDVAADGSLSNERTFATGLPGGDGMAVDEAGNLFVTHGAGVEVIAPSGDVWGRIAVPMTPANCAFGGSDGRTLFITARTGLYQVRLATPGHRN